MGDFSAEAPAGGTVAEVRVSRGDVVAPGSILARLANVARLVVEVHVPIGEVPRPPVIPDSVAPAAGRVLETGRTSEADVRLIRSDGSLLFLMQ